MKFDKEGVYRFARRNLWIFALIVIFLFAFHVRAINNQPEKILSYDPTFEYRYTKYVADFGHMPLWDELSYYSGRPVFGFATLLYYVTAALWNFVTSGFGWSLVTTATFVSALWGAALVIPAYFLGRELSNRFGGLVSAVLVATAPQILVRTFGSSFDTDQPVLFSILLTFYAGLYAFKRRTVRSYAFLLGSLVFFALIWNSVWFSLFVLLGTIPVYLILSWLSRFEKNKISQPSEVRKTAPVLFGMVVFAFIFLFAAASFLQINPLETLTGFLGIAQSLEIWIVNVSIAELQKINIADLGYWSAAFGRFASGEALLDNIIFVLFVALSFFGAYKSFKRNRIEASFFITLLLFGVYITTKGIRFTEFSSAILVILVGAGAGFLFSEWRKDRFLKSLSIGLAAGIFLFGGALALHLSSALGPDATIGGEANTNWDKAWKFLREETPRDSVVGTWWDPGHMVTGLAERRVIADGAHCGSECLYTINDRITDLGKIFMSTSEEEAVNLIKKYKGTSSKAYWISSNDLVQKYQWIEYFSGVCNAKDDRNCPLYIPIGRSDILQKQDGSIGGVKFGEVVVYLDKYPVPVLVRGKSAAFVVETIFYDNDGVVGSYALTPEVIKNSTEIVLGIESALNVKIQNQTLPASVWIRKDFGQIVLIPLALRESLFTKTFFLDGEGLQKFKKVFSNDEVKIYEVEV